MNDNNARVTSLELLQLRTVSAAYSRSPGIGVEVPERSNRSHHTLILALFTT